MIFSRIIPQLIVFSYDLDKNTVRNVEVTGSNDITLTLNGDASSSSNRLVRDGLREKSIILLKTMFKERSDINSIKLIWFLDINDMGKKTEAGVMSLKLTRKTASSIDWGFGISAEKLPKQVDEYSQHFLFNVD